MSRLDRKRGRFSTDFETNEIHRGLEGWQSSTGDVVDYYRFSLENSEMDDLYDEGVGVGKVYDVYTNVPVLHVVREEGGNGDTDTGLYYNDDLHITASLSLLERIGLRDIDVSHNKFLNDRIVYDERVFRVAKLSVLGQIQRRDVIVSIEATQVKPDELVNDQQFAWAQA